MATETSLKIRFELLWWVVTCLVLVAVLLPIYFSTNDYPFWQTNILFIILFITLTRYIFFLKHTFFARKEYLKVILFFLCFPLLFYLAQELNGFQTFLDERGAEAVIGKPSINGFENLIQFIRSEILLFGVGSIIAAIIFPFRLILSIWRARNSNRV